jgi:hypothetical protein
MHAKYPSLQSEKRAYDLIATIVRFAKEDVAF